MACLNFDSPLSLTAGNKVFDISNPNNSTKVKWVHLWGVTSLWCMHCLDIKVTKISLEKYCWCIIRQVYLSSGSWTPWCVHDQGVEIFPSVFTTREQRLPSVFIPMGSFWTPGSHFSNF
jgi:hypothetical protein